MLNLNVQIVPNDVEMVLKESDFFRNKNKFVPINDHSIMIILNKLPYTSYNFKHDEYMLENQTKEIVDCITGVFKILEYQRQILNSKSIKVILCIPSTLRMYKKTNEVRKVDTKFYQFTNLEDVFRFKAIRKLNNTFEVNKLEYNKYLKLYSL